MSGLGAGLRPPLKLDLWEPWERNRPSNRRPRSFSIKASCAAWCSTRAENRPPPIRETNELHRAVVNGAEPEVEHIQGVVLMKLPRPLGPLFWKQARSPCGYSQSSG